MTSPDHNRILAAAGKSYLKPLGLVQKGRSRVWIDDRGWWVGVVEFQPSAWSKGSYLNAGACWLWLQKDHFSLDYGVGYGDVRLDTHREFKDAGDYEAAAAHQATLARDAVLKLREELTTVAAAAGRLRRRRDDGVYCRYHAAVSAGLVGDMERARREFDAVAAFDDAFPWLVALKATAAGLVKHMGSSVPFRAAVRALVLQTRETLKLPPVQGNALIVEG
jgi:hypothetical protein